MGETGHQGVSLALGQVQQSALKAAQFRAGGVDLLAQIEAQICCNLVIARAAGMQFFSCFTDQRREPRLDVHMHVFQADRPVKISLLDILFDLLEAAENAVELGVAQYPHLFQHACMSAGTQDIVAVQALVKFNRCGKGFHEGVRGFGKAPAPGFLAVRFICHNGGCSA